MGSKGIGMIIVVIAGIGAAFYFLKGKVGGVRKRTPSRDPRAGVMEEKRHTPVKEKPGKSQKEMKEKESAKKREKGMDCWRIYRIEAANATNRQEGTIAQNNLAACIAAARK